MAQQRHGQGRSQRQQQQLAEDAAAVFSSTSMRQPVVKPKRLPASTAPRPMPTANSAA
jgi:hypothetical protein